MAGYGSMNDTEREGPAGDVSQRTALWSVSIRVRAGRSKHTPDLMSSLVSPPQAPIAAPETDDRFVPSPSRAIYDGHLRTTRDATD